MTFPEKLLDLRKQENLSQEALAEKLDVSRQAVSRWEGGTAMPDATNLLQLSRLFGVSIDYLLNDDAASDAETPVVRRETQQATTSLRQKLLLGFGIGCGAAGALGVLLMYILSRFIEVPILLKIRQPDGTFMYKGGSNITGRSFKYFIDEFHLEVLIALCILLMIGGAAMLFLCWRSHRKPAAEIPH